MQIVVGPFDQRSTGAAVLPLVIEHLLGVSEESGLKQLAAAPTTLDLRSHGGVLVHSYRDAAARDGIQRVVNVAGAAITWGALHALETALEPASAAAFRELALIDPLVAAQSAALLTGSTSPLAHVPPVHSLFPGAQVDYHAVDLCYLAGAPHGSKTVLLEALASARHVGVSSSEHTQLLTDNDIHFKFEPPPLAAIAQIARLRSTEPPLIPGWQAAQPYLLVELDAETAGRVDAAQFAQQLRRLARLTDLHVVLLTGDRAAAIVRQLSTNDTAIVSVVVRPHPHVVLSLIEHCQGYIGSGVAGRTIAGSFGIPRRSMCWTTEARRARLDEFRRRWDPIGDDLIGDVSTLTDIGLQLTDDDGVRRSMLQSTTSPGLATCWNPDEPRTAHSRTSGQRRIQGLGDVVNAAERNAARSRWSHATVNRLLGPDAAVPGPSSIFDDEWYRSTNPDLTLQPGEGYDHYMSSGWRDQRSPNPCFDPNYYLEQRPDTTDFEPLTHYLSHGWKEERDPSIWFSTSHYLSHNPDIAEGVYEPLTHYLWYGWREDRDPSPRFDARWYRRAYDVPSDTSALVDHIRVGQYEGRATRPPIAPTLIPGSRDSDARVAVLVHLHYPETWADLDELIANADLIEKVFVTVTPDVPAELRERILASLPNAEVVPVENRGRDSRPFLEMLPRLISDGFDTVLKVHGKRSRELDNGDLWRRSLLHALSPSTRATTGIAEAFRTRPELGVAIPLDFTQPLSYHLRNNVEGLTDATQRLGIDLDLSDNWVTSTTVFPRGNMYWFRPAALAPLTTLGLDDFEPETGQTDGAFAHVIERLPGLVVSAHEYDVISFDATGAASRH